MTLEELIAKLNALADNDELAEDNHWNADRLLLEYINNNEVTKAFDSIGKYYA